MKDQLNIYTSSLYLISLPIAPVVMEKKKKNLSNGRPIHHVRVINRHTFILSIMEKSQIWKSIKKLLSDTQVEASPCVFSRINFINNLNKFLLVIRVT